MIAGVYIHRKPNTNNIFYVGYTSDINKGRPYFRWQRNSEWLNIYNEFGFDVEIVGVGSSKDMLELEAFIISEIGLSNLTNILPQGGRGRTGHKLSDEVKLKISKAKTGTITSEETKKLMSEVSKGRKMPKQCIEAASIAKYKPVLYKNKEYPSIKALAKELGLSRVNIWRALVNEKRTDFKYKID